MNVKQLRKHIGATFRLRPLPIRVNTDGTQLSPADDNWRLASIDDRPVRIRLINQSTGHLLELESDNVQERRSPDFLMLRCQLTITARGIDLEPIQKGGAGQPTEAPEQQPVARSEYFNIPPGYEPRLNYHRFQIAREKAASDGRGGYDYPVILKGREEDLKTFCREMEKQYGVQQMITAFSDSAGEIRFHYTGPHSPNSIENLAIKHRLLVAVCGKPVIG